MGKSPLTLDFYLPSHVNGGWFVAYFGVVGYITVLPLGNKGLDFFFLPKCQHMEFHSAFKKDMGVKHLWLSLKELQLGG